RQADVHDVLDIRERPRDLLAQPRNSRRLLRLPAFRPSHPTSRSALRVLSQTHECSLRFQQGSKAAGECGGCRTRSLQASVGSRAPGGTPAAAGQRARAAWSGGFSRLPPPPRTLSVDFAGTHARFLGAVGAAEDAVAMLDAVPDDAAPAVLAHR